MWLGNLCAGLATALLPVVVALTVLDKGLSPAILGGVLAARTVGFLVAAPVAGVLADVAPRRLVVSAASVCAAAGTALLPLVMHEWFLIPALLAFLVGIGQGAYRPAFQALIADVVDITKRHEANAFITLSSRVVLVVAPSAAAILSTQISPTLVLGSSAALWGLVLLTSVGRNQDRPERKSAPIVTAHPVKNFALSFMEGLQEARKHRWFIAGLCALAAQLATGYAATQILLPVISDDEFGGSVVLATALTCYTLGSLGGAAAMMRWRPRRQGHFALLGMALYAGVPAVLALPAPEWGIFTAYAIAGFGVQMFNVPWFTATQREVPAHLLARVSSIDFLVSYGLAPIGLVVLGPASAAFGSSPVLWICAGICLTAPCLAALIPSSKHFTITRGSTDLSVKTEAKSPSEHS